MQLRARAVLLIVCLCCATRTGCAGSDHETFMFERRAQQHSPAKAGVLMKQTIVGAQDPGGCPSAMKPADPEELQLEVLLMSANSLALVKIRRSGSGHDLAGAKIWRILCLFTRDRWTTAFLHISRFCMNCSRFLRLLKVSSITTIETRQRGHDMQCGCNLNNSPRAVQRRTNTRKKTKLQQQFYSLETFVK